MNRREFLAWAAQVAAAGAVLPVMPRGELPRREFLKGLVQAPDADWLVGVDEKGTPLVALCLMQGLPTEAEFTRSGVLHHWIFADRFGQPLARCAAEDLFDPIQVPPPALRGEMVRLHGFTWTPEVTP